MDFTVITCSALVIFAGIAIAIQPAVNAGLAAKTGLPPALIINSIVVLIATILAYYYVVFTNPRQTMSFFPEATPWYLYLGGIGGFIVIITTAWVFPILGAGFALALLVLGQGVAALAIDHFGFLGMAVRTATPERLLGLLCMVAGVVLLRK